MKVLLINGSPHEKGCTRAALDEIAAVLEENGVGAQLFQIGAAPIPGCAGCGFCAKNGRCRYDDLVVEAQALMADCAGLIVGTPVHYASPAGALLSFLDRFFYSGDCFAHKPAAAVASARRAGTSASLDVINKYFMISQMPVVSSTYWNMVHGLRAADVAQDAEGLQTMRNLARNMAWLLRCIEAGRETGLVPPQREATARTNFIR